MSRSVGEVGQWWSILIVRDALVGITRFEDFRQHLGISPTMLTRRLRALVDAGLLATRPYQDRPVRHEYVLTERGRSFGSIVLALAGWGNDHLAGEDRPVIVVDSETGREARPVVVDETTGGPVTWPRYRFAPGSSASARADTFLGAHDPELAAS